MRHTKIIKQHTVIKKQCDSRKRNTGDIKCPVVEANTISFASYVAGRKKKMTAKEEALRLLGGE